MHEERSKAFGPAQNHKHTDVHVQTYNVEMVRDPSLREVPVGIRQKYLLVTCNYEARKFGVRKLEGIEEAKRKCPHIVILDGSNLTPYREASDKIHRYLRSFTPNLRKLGMDETFLDVTELVDERITLSTNLDDQMFCGHLYDCQGGTLVVTQSGQRIDVPSSASEKLCSCGCLLRMKVASQIAEEIRIGMHQTLGYTACAGISTSRVLAKLAGEINKPNQQTVLLPQHGSRFISSLPMRKLPGCGFVTSKQLMSMNVESAEQLRKIPVALLVQTFGERTAQVLIKSSWGLDHDPLEPSQVYPKSMSEEDSFVSCNKIQDVACKLRTLIAELLERLDQRYDELSEIPRTIRLTLRHRSKEYGRVSKQASLPQMLLGKRSGRDIREAENNRIEMLLSICMNLFHKLVQDPFSITVLNVCVTDFQLSSSSAPQISRFFPTTRPVTDIPCSEPGREDQGDENNASKMQEPRQASFDTIGTDDLIFRCNHCSGLVREQDMEEHLVFHRISNH